MTTNELIDKTQPAPEIDFATEATSLLRTWYPLVQALPQLIGNNDRSVGARGLLTWYEHVFDREDYAAEPPIEGLDVLIDELAYVSVSFDVHARLAQARWAIRVAEELVRWRDCLRRSGEGAPASARATDRLEIATEEALRQLGGR